MKTTETKRRSKVDFRQEKWINRASHLLEVLKKFEAEAVNNVYKGNFSKRMNDVEKVYLGSLIAKRLKDTGYIKRLSIDTYKLNFPELLTESFARILIRKASDIQFEYHLKRKAEEESKDQTNECLKKFERPFEPISIRINKTIDVDPEPKLEFNLNSLERVKTSEDVFHSLFKEIALNKLKSAESLPFESIIEHKEVAPLWNEFLKEAVNI